MEGLLWEGQIRMGAALSIVNGTPLLGRGNFRSTLSFPLESFQGCMDSDRRNCMGIKSAPSCQQTLQLRKFSKLRA